jgi:hypothetical protein
MELYEKGIEEECLQGYRIDLEPLGAANAQDIERLDRQRELLPQMGGIFHRGVPSQSFGPPLAIRSHSDNRIIGVIANQELEEYPGVCTIVTYVDQEIAHPGLAIEASALYLDYIFLHGAQRIFLKVIEFNTPMLKILQKMRFIPQVRLRQAYYIAGRFWDVYLYEFDQSEWNNMMRRYQRGNRLFLALGSSKVRHSTITE